MPWGGGSSRREHPRPTAVSRRLAALAAAIALAALAAPSAAEAKGKSDSAKALRTEVPVPAEGGVTIESIVTTVPAHDGTHPELHLFSPNASALPPGVLALSAVRPERTRRETTLRAVLVVLDRRLQATTARTGGEEPLTGFGELLLDGIESTQSKAEGGKYVGFSLDFTRPVPQMSDGWLEQRKTFGGMHVVLGAQPNADFGATDARACEALAAIIRLGPTLEPAPGVTFGVFLGPLPRPFDRDGLGRAFSNLDRYCRAGADGLQAGLSRVGEDFGFDPGELGAEAPLPPVAPIGKEQAELIVWGAELEDEPEIAERAEEDYLLWSLEEAFGAPLAGAFKAPPPEPARAASARSGAAPEGGQVTKVEVRGFFLGGCPVQPESVCEDNLHFQDLRPQAAGGLEVISTTQAFTLPRQPGTYTFEPTDFFVQKGDYVGLASSGGEFKVLVRSPGTATDMFTGHLKDENGDHVSAGSTLSGEALNMRVTLKPSS